MAAQTNQLLKLDPLIKMSLPLERYQPSVLRWWLIPDEACLAYIDMVCLRTGSEEYLI